LLKASDKESASISLSPNSDIKKKKMKPGLFKQQGLSISQPEKLTSSSPQKKTP